jgi:hypothetical protein
MSLTIDILAFLAQRKIRASSGYLAICVPKRGVSKKSDHLRSVHRAIDVLIECKVVVNDRHNQGFVYRFSDTPKDAEIFDLPYGRPKKSTVKSSPSFGCVTTKNV